MDQITSWGTGDGIVGEELALHAADPGLIPGILYGPYNTTKSDPWGHSQEKA